MRNAGCMVKSFRLTRGRVWSAIVVLFALYGFLVPGLKNQIEGAPFDWKYAFGSSISYMAIGICIATCLVVGFIVCIAVRQPDTERKDALLTLGASSIASTMVPTLILICSGLFHGKSGLIFSEAMLTTTISLLSFLIFGGFVFSVSRR
jgi:hypothetical protein